MADVVEHILGRVVQPHDSRCLGWLCAWRDNCARHMEEGEVVIRQWFQPTNTGEHCEHFVKHSPKDRFE